MIRIDETTQVKHLEVNESMERVKGYKSSESNQPNSILKKSLHLSKQSNSQSIQRSVESIKDSDQESIEDDDEVEELDEN